ncbi:MAG: Flp pilus assembly complex ATPase component TadA, partial [Acidobacteria bacterium]|nr:Flp pilus assembly complex ATPase component TadA [Acidobacteriota bacterium]
MSLFERISERQGGADRPPQPPHSAPPEPVVVEPAGAQPSAPSAPAGDPFAGTVAEASVAAAPPDFGGTVDDPWSDPIEAGLPATTARRMDPAIGALRQRIHQLLIDELGPLLFDRTLGEDDLRRQVQEQLHTALVAEQAPLSAADKAQLIQDVTDDILGYGPIDHVLRDEDVSEVMVNGPDDVFVERNGKLSRDPSVRFLDADHVRRVIDKIVSQVGRRIDESTPMVDARLPDGSRVNAVVAPLAIGGPFLTIR